jgi:hypothetical protein
VSGGAAYSIVMAVLLGLLVAVGFLLTRYRDRLHRAFSSNDTSKRVSVDIAPGARITIVEIDGIKIACALGRNGVTAMQIVGKEQV